MHAVEDTPLETDGGRIQTPYGELTTPEIVAARRSLSLAIADDENAVSGPLGDLIVWATIELAERLSAFVDHADGAVFGTALESLAYDLGIVRGPRTTQSARKPSAQAEPPPAPFRRSPVALRRSGARRG